MEAPIIFCNADVILILATSPLGINMIGIQYEIDDAANPNRILLYK